MTPVEQVLHEKALDQVSWLQLAYEEGRISAVTFRVGVETIWSILGGVVRSDDFVALMHAANLEVAGFPSSAMDTVVGDGCRIAILQRRGGLVKLTAAGGAASKERTFDIDDEAIEFANKWRKSALEKGMKEVTL